MVDVNIQILPNIVTSAMKMTKSKQASEKSSEPVLRERIAGSPICTAWIYSINEAAGNRLGVNESQSQIIANQKLTIAVYLVSAFLQIAFIAPGRWVSMRKIDLNCLTETINNLF